MVFFDDFLLWLPRWGGLVVSSMFVLCLSGATALV
jgi:hypothetical protein